MTAPSLSHACLLFLLTGGPAAIPTGLDNSVKYALCRHLAVLEYANHTVVAPMYWRGYDQVFLVACLGCHLRKSKEAVVEGCIFCWHFVCTAALLNGTQFPFVLHATTIGSLCLCVQMSLHLRPLTLNKWSVNCAWIVSQQQW